MTSQQWIVHTTDPSMPNGGDLLVTVYGGTDLHLTACFRNELRHTAWDPPLPVHSLGACEGCGHRGSDHEGGCTLCDCVRLGGVR